MTGSIKSHEPTIAVFDSGFGGLTVLRALLELIPAARYLYLGDTARLPYGSKSRETVARYALAAARFFLTQGADMLVVACNTATALALPELRAALAIPVLGVIQPGAEAALELYHPTRTAMRVDGISGTTAFLSGAGTAVPAFDTPTALVLATAATVQSGAYTDALRGLGLHACEKACPLLVPLVEEGWIDHTVTAEVLRIYLGEALAAAPTATTLVLGCTHYPLLQPLIGRTLAMLGRPLHIVDSARATAQAAALIMGSTAPRSMPPAPRFYATDSVDKFQRLGSRFLGQPLPEVHLLDLGD